VSGWQSEVEQTWARVATERGIDFDPPPHAVTAALPSLAATIERLVVGMDERDRRWLAAALADHVQRTTLPGRWGRPDAEAGSDTGYRNP
jgi:hypothetical protein